MSHSLSVSLEPSLTWFSLPPPKTPPLELPQLLYSLFFSPSTRHLCSFCSKAVIIRCRNSLSLGQIKSECVGLQDSRAPSSRRHVWQESNLGSGKPSASWEVVSFLILLWFSLFLNFSLALPSSNFCFSSSLHFEKWPLRGNLDLCDFWHRYLRCQRPAKLLVINFQPLSHTLCFLWLAAFESVVQNLSSHMHPTGPALFCCRDC